MSCLPPAAEPLLKAIAPAFTKPTFKRFLTLMTGMIITMGRRSVSRALRVVWPMMEGHFSNYHRLYSKAAFSMWKLSLAMIRLMVASLPAGEAIVLIADDTVDGKEGDRVWGKGSHRDAVRSSRGRTHIKYGHKWLVMAMLMRISGSLRPWALPILAGLCRSPKFVKQWGGRPKTASQLTRQFLILMMRRFPDRQFILLGDYGVIGHQTAAFAHRHRQRVKVISRLRGDANLYWPSQKKGRVKGGGKARKGRKRPSPAQQVQTLPVQRGRVAWYGSSRREVKYATCTGLWYDKHHGGQVTPIRWVAVGGESGEFTDYFYCSDDSVEARKIIEYYAMRWNIEVTFEESRALLGLETTRHWCKQSVLRVTPLLFGLFTAVSLIWHSLSQSGCQVMLHHTPCYTKQAMTFADALFAVRRVIWEQGLMRHSPAGECLTSVPRPLREVLLTHLSAAA